MPRTCSNSAGPRASGCGCATPIASTGELATWATGRLEILGVWRAGIGDVEASEQFYRRAVPGSLLACSIVSDILRREGDAAAARELEDYLEEEIRLMKVEQSPRRRITAAETGEAH